MTPAEFTGGVRGKFYERYRRWRYPSITAADATGTIPLVVLTTSNPCHLRIKWTP